MTKLSYQDPIKERAREKLRDFIGEHVKKHPTDMRVLCFPGPEALEVLHVYDALRIPRENIVGLERNKDIHSHLQSSGLGIEVICQSDVDYLMEADERFDIISLDYCGNMTDSTREALRAVSAHGLVNHGGVLATNMLAARENKKYARIIALEKAIKDNCENNGGTGTLYELCKSAQFDLDSRSVGVTTTIVNTLFAGRPLFGDHPLFRASQSYDITDKVILEVLEQHIKDAPDGYKNIFSGYLQLYQQGRKGSVAAYELHTVALLEELSMLGLPPSFYVFLRYSMQGGYDVRHLERYKYISTTGSPMISDYFHLASRDETYRIPSSQLRVKLGENERKIIINGLTIGKHVSLFPRVVQKEIAKIVRKCQSIAKENMEKAITCDFSTRTFIGSSCTRESNPPIPEAKEMITKEDAITLLEAGCTPKEIADVYGGFSVRQLGAIKAHMTMGHARKK